MNDSDLLRRVCDTSFRYLALGNESWDSPVATFVRNPRTPRRYDSNVVGLVRAEADDDIEALLDDIEQMYNTFDHRMVNADALTPRAFETRLAMEDGYRVEMYIVQVLEGDLNASPRDVEIREVLTEDDWSAYRDLDEIWWRESGQSEVLYGPYDRGLHDEMMKSKRAKNPMARSWFAIADGAPRAFLSSWPGDNGVGIVEDLFAHPDYRRHGLGTALLAHCVADARERGAGPVLITSNHDDTPKHMYAAMGFRPLYVQRTWTKRLAPGA